MKTLIATLFLLCLLPCRAWALPEDVTPSTGVTITYLNADGTAVPAPYYRWAMVPGRPSRGVLVLHNGEPYAVPVSIYAGDCYNSPAGKLGGPLEGQPNKEHAAWLSVSQPHVTLKAGDSVSIDFAYTTPPGTPPGDYLAFLFVQPHPPAVTTASTGMHVPLEMRVGTLLWGTLGSAPAASVSIAPLQKHVIDGRLSLSTAIVNSSSRVPKLSGGWDIVNAAGQTVLSHPTEGLGFVVPGHPVALQIPIDTAMALPRGLYKVRLNVQVGEQSLHEDRSITLP